MASSLRTSSFLSAKLNKGELQNLIKSDDATRCKDGSGSDEFAKRRLLI